MAMGSFMTRLSFAVVLAALLAQVASAVAQTRDAAALSGPALKPAATVTGDIVRIGDLVENAGAVAEVPIFRAPDLGQTGNVAVASVLEAIRGQHLVGLDTRGLSLIAVTHAGRSIAPQDIEARILASLSGKFGLPDAGNLAVTFDTEARPFIVEATATEELVVTRLGYEPRTQRFDVALELPGSAVARRLPLHFTGSVAETFAALVPTHDIAVGTVLKPSDLGIERRPKTGLSATTLTAPEQAQGLSAKHALRSGQILHQADVAKPELVARGDTINIVFQVPGILLSVVGKANEAGGLGDVISVVNLQSKHAVQATIIGPGRVSVSAASPRLAENITP
jgi:flagellar basal body P-ring formation protein FlgA